MLFLLSIHAAALQGIEQHHHLITHLNDKLHQKLSNGLLYYDNLIFLSVSIFCVSTSVSLDPSYPLYTLYPILVRFNVLFTDIFTEV